ncbi:hypothetical protein A0J61_10248 [Choanephora cucurbitarum]|uniref:Uncharacterized protein n=1 Tax=Choanephora cucurbitarum TaxID=101091 RepID=A0A1C7N2Z1_9FUNG|nr:hypothetical protein A0J61_10248 [Choanephora cucurbitarum]
MQAFLSIFAIKPINYFSVVDNNSSSLGNYHSSLFAILLYCPSIPVASKTDPNVIEAKSVSF